MANRRPQGAAPAAPAPVPVLETPALVPPPALETQAGVANTEVTTVQAPVDKTETPVETKKTPKVVAEKSIKVRATAKGFYGNARIKVGEVFEIHSSQAFSENWMEKIK